MLGHFTHDLVHNSGHSSVTAIAIGLGLGAIILGIKLAGKAKEKKAVKK